MRRTVGIALVLLLGSASLSLASKVHVDYDPKANFGRYRTFAWANTKGLNLEDVNELAHLRVKDYIEAKMIEAGLHLVDKDPDLWVAYYTTSKDQTRINVVATGYSFPTTWTWDPYWAGAWGMGYGGSYASSGQIAVYTKGTLIIDVVDARTKQLIWRGTLTGSVPDNVDKLSKKIYKGIDKIIRKWHKMRKEQLAREAKGS